MINFYRNQQNILYVCPSDSWGTKERMALRDCLLGKEIGHNVFLYCLKDSPLEKQAKNKKIDCIYHIGKAPTKIHRWRKLKTLVNYVHRLDIALVHCYDFQYLWPMTYFLRKAAKVPLVYTLNHNLKKYYHAFWHKVLLSRIDNVFLTDTTMMDDVKSHLPISTRKLTYYGLGVDEKKTLAKPLRDKPVIGAHITTDFDILLNVKSLLFAMEALISNRGCQLILFCDVGWEKNDLHSKIIYQIEELGLEDDVFLADEIDYGQVDLWVGLKDHSPLEDYFVEALFKLKPCVVPRKESTKELMNSYSGLGETYLDLDSRELRYSILKILGNYESYCKRIEDALGYLRKQYGEEFHKNQIVSSYEKVLNRRLNYYARKSLKS